MSTEEEKERIELLQGTLDLLILRTQLLGGLHTATPLVQPELLPRW